MSDTDLFSALSKYDASNSPENYLTEAFAFLLRHLLVDEPSVAVALLNDLCGADDKFKFRREESRAITVETQVTTDQGRPDMAIRAPNHLVYVEVKKDSPLGTTQPERYGAALDNDAAEHKRLVLLTRLATEVPARGRRPDRCARWFEIYDWLDKAELKKPVSAFISREFRGFLEECHMALSRVGWELGPGLLAFSSFGAMLQAAIERAGLKQHAGSLRGTSRFFGCTLDSPKYWVGIYYQKPVSLCFEFCKGCSKAAKGRAMKECPDGATTYEATGFALDLEDENVHFFALGKERQLEAVSRFLKECHEIAKAAEKPQS